VNNLPEKIDNIYRKLDKAIVAVCIVMLLYIGLSTCYDEMRFQRQHRLNVTARIFIG